jgi:hypothetical protein
MGKLNIKVGQKVYVKLRAYRYNEEDRIKEETVVSIGRKYFTTSGFHSKFDLETGLESLDTNYPARVYLSMDEYNEEIERGKLISKIRSFFSYYGGTLSEHTIEELRQIEKLINKQL